MDKVADHLREAERHLLAAIGAVTLTKTAGEDPGMTKEALIGAAVGAVRAANLRDEERDALIQHYGLDPDANLVLRNAGRGLVGGNAGLLPGLLLAAAGVLRESPALMAAGHLGQYAGYGLGAKLMTDKYSVGNAARIQGEQPLPE